MKQTLWIFAGIFLTAFAIKGIAAERVSLEAMTVFENRKETSDRTLKISPLGDKQLAVRPELIFTESQKAGGVDLPYLVSIPKPVVYPKWAIRQGWEGQLMLWVEIRLDGSVGQCRVDQSSGYGLLDKEAVKAVKSWEFYPAMKNGKPVAVSIRIPITFQLQNRSEETGPPFL